jgi:hypothetical protein
MDCVRSTQKYDVFELMRNKHGELFIYYTNVPETFKADVRRKADKAITHSKNISSVYVPDVTLPFAYGDVKGTSDCILIVRNENDTELEIFVARGQKNNRLNLWQMLSDGELENEIAALKAAAVTESVTKNDK